MQCTSPVWLDFYEIRVPCGHCVNCRIAHSREWAVRIVHEMGYHDDASFLTLTYDDDHMPADGSISKDELQRFFKRLRKNIDEERKIKYFACGEYGEEKGRPHYHAIVLGMGPSEKDIFEKAWKLGNVFLGTVTYDSARYVADYLMKKYSGSKADAVYAGKEAPFQLASLGMGKRFALDNKVYLSKKLGCTLGGKEVGIPKYYKRLLDLGADELGPKARELKEELAERVLTKVGGDIEKVPGALARSRRQANKNALARIALLDDLKQYKSF